MNWDPKLSSLKVVTGFGATLIFNRTSNFRVYYNLCKRSEVMCNGLEIEVGSNLTLKEVNIENRIENTLDCLEGCNQVRVVFALSVTDADWKH